MYFELREKKMVYFINHQQGVCKVYHPLFNMDKPYGEAPLFLLKYIPNWTPTTVAQSVKKLLPFL